MKRLAVIILNWNGIDLLRRLLPTVAANTISDEADLIVADNGPTDGSAEYVAREFPQVRLIRFTENLGFAEGYNRAIAETGYPYTVLLNSDVETPAGWWRPLLDFMEGNPDVGAAQPKIKSFARRDSFEYAGAAGGYLDRLGYPYCRGRFFDVVEKDEGQYDGAPADVTWASGAALTVRTDIYLKVGGLDRDFFAHMEEIDLCCRILRAGYRVCCVPSSEVYHIGGASLPQGNPKKVYLNFRNNLLLLHKNLPPRRGRRILFWRRLADSLAFFMFLAKLDFPSARAIIRAHNDFRRMRGNYTDLPEADILSRQPGSRRMAVLDRYLLRRRK
ncbi:MAG: glycosyltransferase family 2 protein [Bacteroides sp.]|nr:glycosyltransferase family 2 protein [Bacteroides sp.]